MHTLAVVASATGCTAAGCGRCRSGELPANRAKFALGLADQRIVANFLELGFELLDFPAEEIGALR